MPIQNAAPPRQQRPGMSNGLIGHLQDLLADFGAISTRPMFGGDALYRDAVLIGIVLEEALYLKVEAQTRP